MPWPYQLFRNWFAGTLSANKIAVPPMRLSLSYLLLLLAVVTTACAGELPATILAKPGKLLIAEDFSKPLPPPEGSTANFASGFHGWRCNVVPRGGWWNIVDGAFRGM